MGSQPLMFIKRKRPKADGKYDFAQDFDRKFDAMDSEIAEMFA